MGTPYYAVQAAPAVEIVQELMPEEGMGPVREMGYANLPIGVYDTREHPESASEELNHVLHEFEASIAAFDKKDKAFNDAYGVLTISQEQPQLKRIPGSSSGSARMARTRLTSVSSSCTKTPCTGSSTV